MQNKVWMGQSIKSGDRKFWVPDNYELNAAGCGIDEDGRKYIRVKGVRWFTNLDIKQRHEEMILVRRYNPEEYPRYINFNAIEVSKSDYRYIPKVYQNMMTRLSPGEYIISNPALRSLVNIRFPRPAYKQYPNG